MQIKHITLFQQASGFGWQSGRLAATKGSGVRRVLRGVSALGTNAALACVTNNHRCTPALELKARDNGVFLERGDTAILKADFSAVVPKF